MPIDARIPLQTRTPSISDAMALGAEDKQRRIQNQQNNTLFDLAVDDRNRRVSAEDAAAESSANAERENELLRSVGLASQQILPLLDNEETLPQALSFLENRKNDLAARGIPTDQTDELINRISTGDVQVAKMLASLAVKSAESRKLLGSQQRVPSGTQEFEDLIQAAGSDDPTVRDAARVKLGLDARAGSITKDERFANDPDLTDRVAESRAQISAEESAAKTQATGEAKRVQDIIDQGQQVADGAPVLKRTLELLDAVSTGGVLNQAQLQFAQTFGIETADQGELSANLGKAVLGQLRETFGAQFTQQEGERLESIEANFGKNNATNQRLIRQALAIVEAKAKRAIKLARANDDEVTAQIIEDALSLDLSDVELPQKKESVIRFDAQGNRIE